VLSREQTPHAFPAQHTVFLEQVIDYRVPVETFMPAPGADFAAYISFYPVCARTYIDDTIVAR
jgi:hypothetical protein